MLFDIIYEMIFLIHRHRLDENDTYSQNKYTISYEDVKGED